MYSRSSRCRPTIRSGSWKTCSSRRTMQPYPTRPRSSGTSSTRSPAMKAASRLQFIVDRQSRLLSAGTMLRAFVFLPDEVPGRPWPARHRKEKGMAHQTETHVEESDGSSTPKKRFSPVKAKQGRMGTRILMVLIVALMLAFIVWIPVEIWGRKGAGGRRAAAARTASSVAAAFTGAIAFAAERQGGRTNRDTVHSRRHRTRHRQP